MKVSEPCSLNADSQSFNINDLTSAVSDPGWLVAPFTTLNDGKITLLDVGSGHIGSVQTRRPL